MGKIFTGKETGLSAYISASMADMTKAKELSKLLINHGVRMTSTWHDHTPEPDCAIACWRHGDPVSLAQSIAGRNIREIAAANWFIQLTGSASSSGAMHFEMGFAVAIRKPVIIIGTPPHLYSYSPVVNIKQCATVEDFMVGLMTAQMRVARKQMQSNRIQGDFRRPRG